MTPFVLSFSNSKLFNDTIFTTAFLVKTKDFILRIHGKRLGFAFLPAFFCEFRVSSNKPLRTVSVQIIF